MWNVITYLSRVTLSLIFDKKVTKNQQKIENIRSLWIFYYYHFKIDNYRCFRVV